MQHLWPGPLRLPSLIPGLGAWDGCAASVAGAVPGSPGSIEAASCYCEGVFAATQVALTLCLPLVYIFLAERAQRALFVRKHPRLPGTAICFDRLRLLALLAAMIFRLSLALRFEAATPCTP